MTSQLSTEPLYGSKQHKDVSAKRQKLTMSLEAKMKRFLSDPPAATSGRARVRVCERACVRVVVRTLARAHACERLVRARRCACACACACARARVLPPRPCARGDARHQRVGRQRGFAEHSAAHRLRDGLACAGAREGSG
eukprot:6189177-Pleurochrysis_carterae.AAC.6